MFTVYAKYDRIIIGIGYGSHNPNLKMLLILEDGPTLRTLLNGQNRFSDISNSI
jgi:hypothetical protein